MLSCTVAESDARIQTDFLRFDAQVQKELCLGQQFFADFLYHVLVGLEVLLHGSEVSAHVVQHHTGSSLCNDCRHVLVHGAGADVVDDVGAKIHGLLGDLGLHRIDGHVEGGGVAVFSELGQTFYQRADSVQFFLYAYGSASRTAAFATDVQNDSPFLEQLHGMLEGGV